MQTIIIEVSGGVVQEVYGDVEGLRVVLLDWDAGESPGDTFCGGPMLLLPTAVMPDETRHAVAELIKTS
jgi:hypothetical protein